MGSLMRRFRHRVRPIDRATLYAKHNYTVAMADYGTREEREFARAELKRMEPAMKRAAK